VTVVLQDAAGLWISCSCFILVIQCFPKDGTTCWTLSSGSSSDWTWPLTGPVSPSSTGVTRPTLDLLLMSTSSDRCVLRSVTSNAGAVGSDCASISIHHHHHHHFVRQKYNYIKTLKKKTVGKTHQAQRALTVVALGNGLHNLQITIAHAS